MGAKEHLALVCVRSAMFVAVSGLSAALGTRAFGVDEKPPQTVSFREVAECARELAGKSGPEELERIFDQAASAMMRGGQFESVVPALIGLVWRERHPDSMKNYVVAVSSNTLQATSSSLAGTLLMPWLAKNDPVEFERTLGKLPTHLRAVFLNIALHNLPEAERPAFLESYSEDFKDAHMLAGLGANVKLQPLEALNAFAESVDADAWEEHGRHYELFRLMMDYAEEDSSAAWGWYQAHKERFELPGYLEAKLVAEWSKDNLSAAFEHAYLQSDREAAKAQVSEIMLAWAEKDPGGAVARVCELDDHAIRDAALNATLSKWMQKDPYAAVAFIKESLPLDTFLVWAWVYRPFFESDPASALRSLHDVFERLESAGYRVVSREVMSLIASWAKKDALSAIDGIKALPDGLCRDVALAGLAPVLARRHAGLAMEVVESIKGKYQLNHARVKVLDVFIKSDPAMAFHWLVTTFKKDSYRLAQAEHIVGLWAYYDPESAASALEYDLSEAEAVKAANKVAGHWVLRDYEAAAQWAMGLSGKARESAMEKVLSIYVLLDPERAAEYLDCLGESGQRIQHEFVLAWAKYAPREAADWLCKRPEDQVRYKDFQSIMRVWHDLEEACNWVDAMPEGHLRNCACYGLARSSPWLSWRRKIQYAADITDPKRRKFAISSMLQGWWYPPSAEEALDSTELSEQEKAELLRNINYF